MIGGLHTEAACGPPLVHKSGIGHTPVSLSPCLYEYTGSDHAMTELVIYSDGIYCITERHSITHNSLPISQVYQANAAA